MVDKTFIDSLWASLEHSYQLSYAVGNSTGGQQLVAPAKKEHTHSTKINFIFDLLTAIILWDILQKNIQ